MSASIENRGQFGSKLGFILSAAGSAVGLGNIWKFPGKAYNCGGGAFLVIYILMVALIGTTVMLAEFVIGRKTQKNAIGAIRELNSKYSWIGGLGILTGFIILCYYCQVGGWTIKYIIAYITESATVYADPTAYFLDMLGVNGFPLEGAIIYPLIFLALTSFIISRGVADGIEKLSKFLMPLLFILLIGLMIRACTLPGASEGVAYMLHFDASTISGNTFLVALGQAFFSLSLGMGVMITYASYLSKDDNLISNTGVVCVLDTCVALFAGFMIIPAVFATGIDPGTVAYLVEEKGMERKKTVVWVSVVLFAIGIFYTLSQAYLNIKGIWFTVEGVQFPIFGDFMEYLTDRLLLPFGAFFTTVFVGWIWGTDNAIKEATSDGKYKFALAPLWAFLVKFAAPVAILCIIVAGLFLGMSIS